MSAAKHTAGPWFTADAPGKFRVATITPATAVYADKLPSWESITADASLIATSPEMLEILREVDEKNTEALAAMGTDGVTPPAWFIEQDAKIKAVITKAAGGSA